KPSESMITGTGCIASTIETYKPEPASEIHLRPWRPMPAVCSSAPTILPGCMSRRASIMVESRRLNQSIRRLGSRARTEATLKRSTEFGKLRLVFGLFLPHPRYDLFGSLGDKGLVR